MKLLGGLKIDFEKDLILNRDGSVLGSFSGFKEFAEENHPDVVERHRIKSHIEKKDGKIATRKIVNWVEVIQELLTT